MVVPENSLAVTAFRKLYNWLRNSHAMNVLMICDKDKKYPKCCHCTGWDWSCFENVMESCRRRSVVDVYDVGILLYDICVVDVDDKKKALELEARFPVLCNVPCEKTSKGFHYFFLRSELANIDGHYDGAKQVMPGVDFKTTCQTGSCGFVVVTPSANKSWIREPWTLELIPIPDNLLKAISVARHPRIHQALHFVDTDEGMLVQDSSIVSQMDYFKAFIQSSEEEVGDEDERDIIPVDKIPVPNCNKDTFEHLLFVCKYRVTLHYPTDQYISRLLTLADFLGVPLRYMQAFRPGGYLAYIKDVEKSCELMAQWMHYEDVMHILGKDDDANLVIVPVFSEEYDDVSVNRHRRGKYLFPHAELAGFTKRDELSIPHFAQDWLDRFPNSLILAGGAALSAVIDVDANDFDFFVVNTQAVDATDIVRTIAQLPNVRVLSKTSNAVTYHVCDGQDEYVAQIILRLYPSPWHVVCAFDFQPCKIYVKCTGPQQFAAFATHSWHISIATCTFTVDIRKWGAASFQRVLKYAHKGFDVMVPCIEDAALRSHTFIMREGSKGVGQLLAFLYRRRSHRDCLPSLSEVQRARSRRFAVGSDYDTFASVVGPTFRWMKWMMRKWFGYGKPKSATLIDLDAALIHWRVISATDGNFQPQNPSWMNFHIPDRWAFLQLRRVTRDRRMHDYLSLALH